MYLTKVSYLFALLLSFSILVSCGGNESGDTTESGDSTGEETTTAVVEENIDPMEDVGVGPVKELTLADEIDPVMAEKGQAIFKEKCKACHKISKKFIGPSPKGVLDRRNPAWVMNMILNPEEMVQKNAQAKKLLMEFNGSPMANQNLTEEEARTVIEYFRTL